MSIADPSPELLASLKTLVGPQGWRSADDPDAARYLEEPRGKWRGRAAIILKPAGTAEVTEIVKRCAAARAPITPYGGGTGLVGGQVITHGPAPVILSLERMAAIRSVDPLENALVAEGGAILANIHSAAERVGRLFPLSLGSQGSARIGGLLATNAGGVAVLRYGNMRDLTLGIEAVLPDGSVFGGLRTLRKDNTGYDLRHLLIGSEGTLGVITAAALKLFPRPRGAASAFVAVASPMAAGALLRRMQDAMDGAVSAFELLSDQGMAFLAEHVPDAPRPPVAGPWHVLVEATGADGAALNERLEAGLAAAFEAGEISDAAIAQSEAQRASFWRIREETPEANRRVGAVSSHDISLPLAALPRFIEDAAAAVAGVRGDLRINCFGHLGDGNLHYNVFPPAGMDKQALADLAGPVQRAVHDCAHAFGGSVSAEHGVGRLKTADLERYGDPGKLAAMRAIKRALDPAGIMNPGAVLA